MKKEERLHHIFQVYDYKGGELSTLINISYDEFIDEIVEFYEGVDIKENLIDEWINLEKEDPKYALNNILYDLQEILDKYEEENTSIYAGGGDTVAEYYYTENNKLIEVDMCEYKDEITKRVYNNIKEYHNE